MKTDYFREIKKRYALTQERNAERVEQIQAQEKTLAALRQEQEAAAEAGNVELYKAKAEEIRDVENVITVLMKTKDFDRVTPEELAEGWRKYTGAREKEYAAGWKNYNTQIRKAAECYEDLTEAQNADLLLRNEIAVMAGIDPDTENGRAEIEELFPAYNCMLPYQEDPYFPNRTLSGIEEYQFFGRRGIWNSDADTALNAIVRMRKPIKGFTFNH